MATENTTKRDVETQDEISCESLEHSEKRRMKKLYDDFVKLRRPKELLKMLSYQLIPMIALVIMCGILLYQSSNLRAKTELIQRTVRANEQTTRLVLALEVERGLSASFLSSNSINPNIFAELQTERRTTDHAFANIDDWPETVYDKSKLQVMIWSHRTKVDRRDAETSFETNIMFYTNITGTLIKSEIINLRSIESAVWYEIVAIDSLLLSADLYGIERALGSVYFLRCFLNESHLSWFNSVRSQAALMLDQALNFHHDLKFEYNLLLDQMSNKTKFDVQITRSEISCNKNACEAYTPSELEEKALKWFDDSTAMISVLVSARGILRQSIDDHAKGRIIILKREIFFYTSLTISSILLCVLLSTCHGIKSHNILSSIGDFGTTLVVKSAELARERKVTQRLLYQTLPVAIAKKLQAGKSVEAMVFDNVTIYLSAMVGFTDISVHSSPIDVVHLLNHLYSICDNCIDKYDVYKVETIGDAYMVVSGMPEPTERHAWEVATMALDLLQITKTCVVPHSPNEHIQLRIGIHTGPCAAGVVGLKMPRYCLFGDTVNTASRMESTGSAMMIHLSEASKIALETDRDGRNFIVIPRGNIDVKGKGSMKTYWLDTNQSLSPRGRRQVGFTNARGAVPALSITPSTSPTTINCTAEASVIIGDIASTFHS